MKKLIAIILLFLSTQLNASVTKYEFTGTVDFIPTGDFVNFYQKSASGYFMYDTNWFSSGGEIPNGTGTSQSYISSNDNWAFGLNVENYSFHASSINTTSPVSLIVTNNGTFTDPIFTNIWDEFGFNGITDDLFHFQIVFGDRLLQPEIPDAFNSTAIPTSLLLDDFNTASAIISGNNSRLRVELNSLTEVPSPAPIALMLIGLAGICLMDRHIKPSNINL